MMALPLMLAAAVAPPFDLADRTRVLEVHATGAQIYQCRAMRKATPTWELREPIASLFKDGKTIGRHYAGTRWALDDGSVVEGKVLDTAPESSAGDIPQLKLAITGHPGHG